MKNFLIITANKYPKGDAGSVRLHCFAKMLETIGYVPIIICMGDQTEFSMKTYEGISFCSLRYRKHNLFFRLLGRVLFLRNLKRTISKIDLQRINGILIDSGSEQTFKYIEKFAFTNNIQLYYDAVEWYSPKEFKLGKISREYKHNNNINAIIINKKYKVIAISRYLEKHFNNKHIDVLRIPMIMDVKKISNEKVFLDDDIRRIVYAGSPGGKDHLKELVNALSQLPSVTRDKIQLCIIGINKKQYEKRNGNVPNNVLENVVFKGRVSREEVFDNLKNADVAFLLRPEDERYSKAGFPTKVVEALSTGTPVFCNYTSDLQDYLVDGVNSIKIDDCSSEACVNALKRLTTYSKSELKEMTNEARLTAERYFDWRLYLDCFRKFTNCNH